VAGSGFGTLPGIDPPVVPTAGSTVIQYVPAG
jgi:hypothetical protein